MDDATRPRQRAPTLKTIAGLTDLAVPTVSRALSGALDISEDTRARVRAVADEIGYVPNRAGVRLRTGRTNVISLVMSTEHDIMNHTAKLISSVSAGLRNTPFHLIITPYFPDEDPMKPIRYIVESRSADAVIFNQIQPQDPRVRYLLDRKFPFATHGRSNWAKDHAWFDFDNFAYGRIAVETLAARGRRHLLLVPPPDKQSYGQEMIAGCSDTARRLGIDLQIVVGFDSDSAIEDVQRGVSDLLDRQPAPDGIITGSTNSALGAGAALRTGGIAIGRDIDVFTKEAMVFLRRVWPEILTVSENVVAAGDFLARAAIAQVTHPKEDLMQKLDAPTWQLDDEAS
ncbi:LacI family transcriptional regulator [Loktanella sp. DSM 29012]|uniref:LacI family transcriptional regulator n=1 Tax=Loktanella sp. DSM 29012 TaxID=1881056 RepID=UPI0008BC6A3C|nr:LacI family transcriptional regulator [Loktanella sp. DSM 29012]SEQ55518.1 LacI family transcriptional regulator [Loktanella sp. DSM 29012]